MTEREKMLAGGWFDPRDAELTAIRDNATRLMHRLNVELCGHDDAYRAALRELMQKEIEAQKAEQQTAIREEGRVEIGEAGDLAFLFDEAAADDLMNVLEHADCRSCGNQEILKIILDEADAFFKGRKTAQEAAQVMDRRAALFIAEAG